MAEDHSHGVTILGSTGTIGVNTLDVIRRNPHRYRVVALTADRNHERMVQQCVEFEPEYAVMANADAAYELEQKLASVGLRTKVQSGEAALVEVAALAQVSQVMAGIVGAAGLLPTLAAAHAGKRVLLANKEALVMSGSLFMDAIRDAGAELLPIDSEHNAIFQCMPPASAGKLEAAGVSRILLTGSGGPFRTLPLDQLPLVTPDQACAHPNWVMGRKISVDSASMMNKGLEFIEACFLFDARPEQIEIVVHPESVIHSMVSYRDGSVLAQLGNPDMRTPIAHAMAWPERIDSGVAALDMIEVARLTFERPDFNRFPCLTLAREAFEAGGAASAVLNASNEVAVAAFLSGRVPFTAIPATISHCLDQIGGLEVASLDAVLAADAAARAFAGQYIRDNFREGGK